MSRPEITLKIDATGLRCPMPLLKAKLGLNSLEEGEVLQLKATDPGSLRDIKSFTSLTRHELIEVEQAGQYYLYLLKKGGEATK